jgi:phosphoribosylformimino-5-aminoimidazole carboxamide ribonucleotide (ProFAR) isomerase
LTHLHLVDLDGARKKRSRELGRFTANCQKYQTKDRF